MAELYAFLAILAIGYLLLHMRGAGISAACRWRRDPTHKTGASQRYVCRRCGVDAFTRDGRAPEICHRAARDTN